jgi:hypothetical protein
VSVQVKASGANAIAILSTAPFDELGPKNVTKKREKAVSTENQQSNSPKGKSLAMARNGNASRQGGGPTKTLVGACRAVPFDQDHNK